MTLVKCFKSKKENLIILRWLIGKVSVLENVSAKNIVKFMAKMRVKIKII